MKKVKGLLAMFMIMTILVGGVELVKINPSGTTENPTNIAEYKTLDDPKPIRS